VFEELLKKDLGDDDIHQTLHSVSFVNLDFITKEYLIFLGATKVQQKR
jgi:hypothetical protein